MGNYFTRAAVYYLKSKAYELRRKEPFEDQLLDNLRSRGISMVDINLAMDKMNPAVPMIARLPGVLKGRMHLVDLMNSAMLMYPRQSKNVNLSRDKMAQGLARYISKGLHTELAFDPEVFAHIMRSD